MSTRTATAGPGATGAAVKTRAEANANNPQLAGAVQIIIARNFHVIVFFSPIQVVLFGNLMVLNCMSGEADVFQSRTT